MYFGQFVQIREVFNAEYDVNRQNEYAVVVGAYEHEIEVMFSDGMDALYHEDDLKPVIDEKLEDDLDKKFVRKAWMSEDDFEHFSFKHAYNLLELQNRE